MLWGNNDSKTATGGVAIAANGLVTGSGTSFQSETKVGDFITVANTDYLIVSITSNTAAQVVGPQLNTTVTAQSNAAYILSEKPKYVLLDDGVHGIGGLSNNVYGVDVTEAGVGNGTIQEVVITFAGSGYTANATVTVTGGAGNTVAASANAFVNTSIGDVTQIKFANNGVGYTVAPTLTISAPTAIVFNGNTAVTAADDTIALTAANSKFQVGDRVTYAGNTLSTPTGLTDTAQYYVSFANSTVIALSTTPGGANVDIGKASGDNTTAAGATLTGETATAVAILSRGTPVAHAGWVRRIVGTGGRAGRVQMETLVAMGTIAGDAEDQVFKDA